MYYGRAGEERTASEKLVEKYKIHFFAVGEEYEEVKPGKKDAYELPRTRGMIRYTKRTTGHSGECPLPRHCHVIATSLPRYATSRDTGNSGK